MSITILFVLAPIGVIVAWWLSRQRLMAKPWLEVSAIGEVPDTGAWSLSCSDDRIGCVSCCRQLVVRALH